MGYEDKNMKNEMKNDEAVSPVIATILMVAITVVLAGVLYVWASDLANNNQEDSPDLYQYTATDHAANTPSAATDDTLFTLQFSRAPKDINWANLAVQIVGADGNPTTCSIGAASGNCNLYQFGSDNLTWEKSEIIHVQENGLALCAAAPCSFSVKISDTRSGVDLTGSSTVVAE